MAASFDVMTQRPFRPEEEPIGSAAGSRSERSLGTKEARDGYRPRAAAHNL